MNPLAEPLEPLLGVEDLAALLGITVKAVYAHRYRGTGPRGFRVGKCVKFRPADVRTWLEAQATAEVVIPLRRATGR
jgi:predicted DNA-binding transcriptional regulator AlpA